MKKLLLKTTAALAISVVSAFGAAESSDWDLSAELSDLDLSADVPNENTNTHMHVSPVWYFTGSNSEEKSTQLIAQTSAVISQEDCGITHLSFDSGIYRPNDAEDGFKITLSDSNITPLTDALKTNTSLVSLNLRGNSLGTHLYVFAQEAQSDEEEHDNAVKKLVDALEGNTTLTELNLSSNNYHTDGISFEGGVKSLARFLTKNFTLTSLDLSCNALNDDSMKALGHALKSNSGLMSLDLSHQQGESKITEAGVLAFMDALADNQTLFTINLEGNSVGKTGLDAISNFGTKRVSLFALLFPVLNGSID